VLTFFYTLHQKRSWRDKTTGSNFSLDGQLNVSEKESEVHGIITNLKSVPIDANVEI